VTSLPGATNPLMSNQFSGYLNVSNTRGIHYMYFESERDPEKDSVIFWTNGGPGTAELTLVLTRTGRNVM
jgi:carboxypeptidase C (cathepsin A)